jgi:hypothetical protein
MYFVWISEKTAIISLYSINWLVFITDGQCSLRGTDCTFKCSSRLQSKAHASTSKAPLVSPRRFTAPYRSVLSMCTATTGSPGHTRKLRYAVAVYRNSSLLICEKDVSSYPAPPSHALGVLVPVLSYYQKPRLNSLNERPEKLWLSAPPPPHLPERPCDRSSLPLARPGVYKGMHCPVRTQYANMYI